MSQNAKSFELPNVVISNSDGDTAANARAALSNFAITSQEARQLGKAAADGAVAGAGAAAGRAAEEQMNFQPAEGKNALSVGKILNDAGKHLESRHGSFKSPDVTDKDRQEAKAVMAKDLSEAIPEADRKAIIDLQGAVIDGNLARMQESLKSLSGDPEKLAKMVKELNKQFSNHDNPFDGVNLTMDGKGNVLLYEKNSNTAVSINPASGETTLRAVEQQIDGSVLLKDGEIINRNAADVMKSAGDSATRGITYEWFNQLKPTMKGASGISDLMERLPRPAWENGPKKKQEASPRDLD